MPVLELDGLEVRYGAIPAVRGVSLAVEEGEVLALVGANGAGKSTTLKAVIGLVQPSAGQIRLGGASTGGRPTAEIVRAGVALCPEGRRVFPELTVLKNLLAGAYARRDRRGVEADLEEVFRYLPVLRARRRQLAGSLSGGEQQMLAIARALMARPRILLLDEPTLGLAPLLVQEIARLVRDIRARGVAILLAEQNAFWALQLADRALGLETGRPALGGPARDLLRNPYVQKAYLGG